MSIALSQFYDKTESWLVYRRLLSERFGISFESAPEEQFVKWRGHNIHLDVWAPREVDSPNGTLILVHGAGGHGRLLAPLADFAAGLGWRVIAAELPGYGLTQPKRNWNWNYGDWPDCVAWLADEAASQGPVVLMGLSVGGMTALGGAQLSKSV
jgi:alpha-beta hydrolase superfamily lysophospholipase